MTTRTILAALCAVAAAAPVLAEKQPPPAPGAPEAFAVPAPARFVLENGLAVTFVDYGGVPKVRVVLSVRVGNVDEEAPQVWLADLTGRMLAEGTTSRTAAEVSEAAARMGGSLDVAVGAEDTSLSGDVLSEYAPEFVGLVADVARHPAFPEAEVARIKTDLLRDLSIARSQSQQLALEKFRAVLYGDHPFGRLFPTPEMVQGYGVDDVRAFYGRGFGPARAHLYVVGRFDHAKTEAAVREAFSAWTGAAPQAPPPPAPKSTRSVYIVDRPDAVQTTLVVGLPVVDPSKPDYVALAVTNTLLGGYFSSRVTTNIREDKGYTYSPFSQISSRRGDAYWAQNADVSTEVTGAALKEILFEIDRLRAEPPSPKELDGVKSYMSGVFVLQNSSRAGIVSQLEFIQRHGLPDDYLRTYVARIHAVTPTQVQQMAQRYIRGGEATIVAVGDRKKIASQLAPFEPRAAAAER
jgi:zinc protease